MTIYFFIIAYPPFPGECNFEDECSADFSFYTEGFRMFAVSRPSSSIRPTIESTFEKEGKIFNNIL